MSMVQSEPEKGESMLFILDSPLYSLSKARFVYYFSKVTCSSNAGRAVDNNRRSERVASPGVSHCSHHRALHFPHPMQEFQHGGR